MSTTKKVLKRDIVIKAGTVFDEAPNFTERTIPGHYMTTVGLTKDSSGDFDYFIDPNDPELEDWFADEDEWVLEKKEGKGKIILMPGATMARISPERILEAAKGQLKDVLVLGIEKNIDDGEDEPCFWFASNTSDKERNLWIAQNFINQLLNGFRDMDDEVDL